VCALGSDLVQSVETCVDQQELPQEFGLNLIQAHRSKSGLVINTTSSIRVNPSGAAAPLDEAGYTAVADRCCQAEMQVFIQRKVADLGMEVCDTAGLRGIVPYHSCDKGPQSFAALESNLLEDSAKTCTWLANTGSCKPLDPSCPTFENVPPLPVCGCSRSAAVLLDFENANMITNNLGGNGPDTGVAEEMRYGNIGEYPAGEPFDMIIVALTSPFVNKKGYVRLNGIWKNKQFGNIALDNSGEAKTYSNEIKLQVSFVRPGGSTPVELPEVFFAVFDVDGSGDLKTKQTLSGKGYKGYVTDADTELVASKSDDGFTKFTATQGDVVNPADPMTATKKQRQSMVMYFFEGVSSFEFTFGLIGNGARNFNFAGKSALMVRCGN